MLAIYYRNTKTKKLNSLENVRAGAWVHAQNPSEEELQILASSHGLDEDLLKDAVDLYEAPRVETEDGIVYIFARYATQAGADMATHPLLIAIKGDSVITVMNNPSTVMDNLFNGKTQVITTMKTKLLLQILTAVNASYQLQLNRIGKKILSIRGQLKKEDIDNNVFISFIDLEEDLNEFLSALLPQKTLLHNLITGKVLTLYEEDQDLLEDLELNTAELVEIAKSRLKTISNTREAYATIMANTLNKTFKRLTSISIFMTIPTITATLYGMNLVLPLAKNPNAFWIILAIVMAMTVWAVWYFQKKKWL